MSRSQCLERWARSEPITTQIIEGRWKGRRFPGTPRFVANCRKLAGAYRGNAARPHHGPTVELFAAIERASIILDGTNAGTHHVVELALRMARHHAYWVRPLDAWSPAAPDSLDQLSELVRHLFERYPAPRFFEHAWRPRRGGRTDWQAFEWYIHVAGGGSIRTAPKLPVQLNRRAAHAFTTAPSKLTPREALRWARLCGAGVPPHLVSALLPCLAVPCVERVERVQWDHDALWLPFFEKLGAAPELRPEQVGPLVDYVRHRARDPSFSLKGQSVASLLRGADRWHAELGRLRAYRTLCDGMDPALARWNPLSGVAPLDETRHEEVWSVQELVSFDALFDEGRRMHHCVASYVRSCMSGATSVWSLRIERFGVEVARVTLRVDVASRTLVEARRFANAAVTTEQHRWLEKWAALNRLSVAAIPVIRE